MADTGGGGTMGISGNASSGSSSSPPKSWDAAKVADADDNDDPVAAALAEDKNGGRKSKADGVASRPAAEDPSLAIPKPSRDNWESEMKSIREVTENATISDEEKIRILHQALTQRIEDTQRQQESKVNAVRRLTDAGKERERHKAEVQRALSAKVKLESYCRELQQQKINILKENQQIAEEEESRHTELKDKFQQAMKDVQEKMDAELEVRQHFLRENEDLRTKLKKFTETYEAQEIQLAEQREARGREMEVAEQRLREHERMCSESKVKTASLGKHNDTLKKSQTVLRNELQTVVSKFDEFHEAVAGSNQRHGECKNEVDELQTRLQDLEKENGEMRSGAQLAAITQELETLTKQRGALEKLCDNLTKDNKKLQEQLDALKQNTSKS